MVARVLASKACVESAYVEKFQRKPLYRQRLSFVLPLGY